MLSHWEFDKIPEEGQTKSETLESRHNKANLLSKIVLWFWCIYVLQDNFIKCINDSEPDVTKSFPV